VAAHAKGAAAAIRAHVAQCGTKGNRKPSTKVSTSNAGASTRVGGYAGGSFDNGVGRS
jgi:hypothetical protein